MLSRPATDGLCGVQAEDSVVVTGIGGVARSGENGKHGARQGDCNWTG